MLKQWVVLDNSKLGSNEILISEDLKNELGVDMGDYILLHRAPITDILLKLKIVGFSKYDSSQEISIESCAIIGLDVNGDTCYIAPARVSVIRRFLKWIVKKKMV
jgi:ABC-type lipoprotein release transport system permease subunit